MGTGWELTSILKDKIFQYAAHNQTPLSLRQMVQFGPSPSPGSIFLASKFIVEELPIRLAKKVKDLELAPQGLNESPSTIKVKNWYAQSFQELTELPKPAIDENLARLLFKNGIHSRHEEDSEILHHATNYEDNPAVNNVFSDDGMVLRQTHQYGYGHAHGHSHSHSQHGLSANVPPKENSPTFGMSYFNPCPMNIVWPREVYAYNKLVCDALTKIKLRHDATVATMAQGVQEWKERNRSASIINSQIQTFLDRFYMSRIGIRMLIGQHIALNMSQSSPTKQRINTFLNGSQGSAGGSPVNSTTAGGGKLNYVGVICTDCNVAEIAEDAIQTASYICEEYYGLFEAPEIQLVAPHHAINFMYVPGHLIHMLFETLKNSLRATIEFHTPLLKKKMMEEDPKLKYDDIDINDLKFPPIKVIISEGSQDITIKISDEGGGIARREVPLIWTYLYTTVHETPKLEPEFNQTSFKAPMAGFGYGLPISRLYAQYFGGDLKLISMEGYGTDVYLHLNRLSSSSEPLP
ncbi:Pyruvate dehydrogenase [Spathaspora sp. JA1]|nr:Pyruvate dehydrogenase [Spathaspora sp. JA1]